MRRAAVLLMALAIALSTSPAAATPPGTAAAARKSRFLQSAAAPALSFYDCSKKSPAVCLQAGSPGPTCCGGKCVDTNASFQHCGNCNKTCKYSYTCCGGKCVDLLFNKKNCGKCFNRCAKKCLYGFCNYAQ